jgi:UDP-glucuronate 4-epimerase
MKVLVTGHAGFIGFHLCRRLIADGHLVSGIDAMVPYYDVRLKERRVEILARSNAFRGHEVNLVDMERTRAVILDEEPDVIVHLAAQAGVRYALENPRSYIESNVVGTYNIIEICRERAVKHLMLASTSSVYGANPDVPFRETDMTDHPLTIYSASKKATELVAHSYAHLWNIPTTAFRFFTVYGPWGRPDMALFKFVDAMLKGEPIDVYNHGKMERDFTYIDDLVEGIVRLIPAVPVRGAPVAACDSLSPVAPFRVVNIGNGQPVTLTAFIEAIEHSLGRTAVRNYMDMQPGDVPRTFASADLLAALTGFRPNTPVEQGVEAFVAWFREYYRV